MKCVECQNELPRGVAFCPACGSAVFEEPEAVILEPVAEEAAEPTPAAEKKPFWEKLPVKKLLEKKVLKWWAAAGVCLVAVVAILVIAGSHRPAFGVYATGDSLMLIDLSGGETVRLAGNISLTKLFMTKDGNGLFYEEGDDITRGGLYYLDLRSDPKEPVKLAKKVNHPYVNEKGTGVGYIREGDLYAHDLESETLIAEDVTSFLCDEDMDTFAFVRVTRVIGFDMPTYERTWYFQDGKAEPVLVGEGRENVEVLALSADGKTMIYSGDGGIYAWENGKETVIVEDAARKGIVYKDMTFYYYQADPSGQATLYFYNGKESVKITDNQAVSVSGEQSILRWQDEESGHCFVALRERVLEIPIKQAIQTELSEDGKTLYVTTQGEDKKKDLYTVDISRGEAGQVQLLLEDALYIRLEPLGKRLYYWVRQTGNVGDLYCDGELVLKNVQSYFTVHEETETLLVRGEATSGYYADIYMVRDGKTVKLTDQGGTFGFATNGDALVVTGEGELWCYDRRGTGKRLADNALTVYTLRAAD